MPLLDLHASLPIVVVLAGLALPAPPTPSAGQDARASDELEAERPELGLLRARWFRKSAGERDLLRRRFEKLRELSPDERQVLIERARAWKRLEGELQASAPEDVRSEIEQLGPDRSRMRWRELMQQRSREMGRDRLERLPGHLRRRLEEASPMERRHILERFRHEQDRRSRRAIYEMGSRAGLSAERIRALSELPLERRLEVLLELRRRSHERGGRRDPSADDFFRRLRRGASAGPRNGSTEGRPGDRWRRRRP